MKSLGRLSFILSLPLLRWYLRRTRRAYGLIVQGDEVLLVKAWLARQEWQLPGGGLKGGESPEQAVVREVWEETGIDIKDAELKEVMSGRWQTDNLGHAYTIYLVRLLQKKPPKALRPELVAASWIRIDELNAVNCADEILQALRAAGLL